MRLNILVFSMRNRRHMLLDKSGLVYLCFSLLLIYGCGSEMEDGLDFSPSVDDKVETIIPTGSEKYLNLDSDYIFDQNRLPIFELNVPQTNLAKIDGDPAAEVYVEGSLTFEGETLSPVGVRYKGSIGAYVGCVSGSDWSNPSGHKTCTKLSMKVKINWLDKDDKFYGVKKLQFHSQNLDDSQMRDRLGYHLFAAMGVPSPRCVHAKLYINGQYNGLFALVEQIDGRFTRQNFDDGSGNLYKEVWPLDMHGRVPGEQYFINALKTNEDENPSAERIRSFGRQVAAASTDSLQNIIDRWMDIDEIISYAVVDRTIRVDDGPFHWYCGGGNCTNHNYYWYEDPSEGSIHLIPWDLDNAFENIAFDVNPVTPIADGWGEISNDCRIFNYGAFNIAQRSAACDKLTSGWVSFDQEYFDKKQAFLSGPFSEENVNQLLDKWSAQIRSATIEARETNNDAVTLSEWEGALQRMKSDLRIARTK